VPRGHRQPVVDAGVDSLLEGIVGDPSNGGSWKIRGHHGTAAHHLEVETALGAELIVDQRRRLKARDENYCDSLVYTIYWLYHGSRRAPQPWPSCWLLG
jgi:hypothetical protein